MNLPWYYSSVWKYYTHFSHIAQIHFLMYIFILNVFILGWHLLILTLVLLYLPLTYFMFTSSLFFLPSHLFILFNVVISSHPINTFLPTYVHFTTIHFYLSHLFILTIVLFFLISSSSTSQFSLCQLQMLQDF